MSILYVAACVEAIKLKMIKQSIIQLIVHSTFLLKSKYKFMSGPPGIDARYIVYSKLHTQECQSCYAHDCVGARDTINNMIPNHTHCFDQNGTLF